MTSAQVKNIVIGSFANKKFTFWIFIRFISAFGPIILTYIFSRGVAALETGKPVKAIIIIFLIYLCVEVVEHVLRIGSKTRISYYSESIFLTIQTNLNNEIPLESTQRALIVQSFRNLTQSLRRFVIQAYDAGIEGVVAFSSIPLILFFVDKRVFTLEIVLIVVCLIVFYFFSQIYEKDYEKFDATRETYFSDLEINKNVAKDTSQVKEATKKVQDVLFFNWITQQNIISFFQFLILYIMVIEIIGGTKQISDLVLVFGYTKETKVFLNRIIATFEHIMEVKAGVERVAAVSRDGLLAHKY